MSFENDFNRLQEIVQQLEDGDLPLQSSLELFEEGIALFRRCQEELNQAEGKISQLVKLAETGFESTPFDLNPSRTEK